MATIPWMHLLRDGAVVVLTAALWVADAALREGGGASATAVGLAAGALTALCGYLIHEWGHLTGARLAGSVVHLPKRATEVFLFRFDSERNRRRHFLTMSLGGFLATALVLAGLLLFAPRDALSGRLALGLAAAGTVATLTLEIPPFVRVWRGAPLPTGAAYRSGSA